MSRASGRKHYLWTAFRPTEAGGNLLPWVVKGTQIPASPCPAVWILPYGKQREQSPCCSTPQEVSSDRSVAAASLYEHPNPITSTGRKMHSPREAQAVQVMCPWSHSQEHQHPSQSLPGRPSSPQCHDWDINQCHMFSLSSHWKKCTSPHPAREVAGAGGWIPESFRLKPYPQWISQAKRWFSKLLSPQHI